MHSRLFEIFRVQNIVKFFCVGVVVCPFYACVKGKKKSTCWERMTHPLRMIFVFFFLFLLSPHLCTLVCVHLSLQYFVLYIYFLFFFCFVIVHYCLLSTFVWFSYNEKKNKLCD